MANFFKNRVDALLFVLGFFFVLTPCAFMLLAGDDVIVRIHDQLDIEIGVYSLHATHFFTDDFYYEMMNGLPVGNAAMFSPGTVLFFIAFSPASAFAANYTFVACIAYASLFALLRSINVRAAFCSAFSVLYAWLPFYSVYGLTVMGVPLVALAVKWVWDANQLTKCWLAALIMIFFALFSSVADVGYSVCVVLLILAVVEAVRQRSLRGRASRLLCLFAILTFAYIAFNAATLMSVLGFTEMGASHRVEFSLASTKFDWEAVIEYFFSGTVDGVERTYHAASKHYYLAVFCFAVIVAGWVASRGHAFWENGHFRLLCILVLSAFAVSLFYFAFHSVHAVELREHLPGALRSFQADRFYFLLPAIWFTAAPCAAEYLMSRDCGARMIAWRIACIIGVVVMAWATAGLSLPGNEAYATAKAQALGVEAPPGMTRWSQFYETELFERIANDIGEPQNSYRVVSVGLFPSIALYNGFYCLDGYSVSYPLSYKHEFEAAIAGELDASPELSRYFRQWGSRCYAFSHELGTNYYVGKESDSLISDLRFNIRRFADMGLEYVFSSVPIVNCEDNGLEEFGRYDTDDSYYAIWVYKVNARSTSLAH